MLKELDHKKFMGGISPEVVFLIATESVLFDDLIIDIVEKDSHKKLQVMVTLSV